MACPLLHLDTALHNAGQPVVQALSQFWPISQRIISLFYAATCCGHGF